MHTDGSGISPARPGNDPSTPTNGGTSARANCMSLASAWRRSWAVGRERSLGETAAIMVRRRFARGSSGISVLRGAASWRINSEIIAMPARLKGNPQEIRVNSSIIVAVPQGHGLDDRMMAPDDSTS